MRFHGLLTLAGAMLLASLGGAAAAPQILALVATNGAKELQCDGDVCVAEFTTMCLQEERRVPVSGTEHTILEGSEITVEFTRPDGTVLPVAASTLAPRLATLRGQMAMEIGLQRRLFADYGAASAAISVGPQAFLVPRPVAGDPEPITLAEIERVTGRHTTVARGFHHDLATELAVVRITSELINALPIEPPPKSRRQTPRASELPVQAVARIARSEPDASAMDDAIGTFRACQLELMLRHYGNVRTCLQDYHDKRMIDVNTRYWRRVGDKG